MSLLHVRPSLTGDAPFLVDLALQAYRDVVTLQFGSWDEAEQAARFSAKLERVPFEVAELGQKSVAAVSASIHSDHVFLNELLVLPAFQNRGFGSFLLDRVVSRAEEIGVPLRLHTLRMNRAIRLYERRGFGIGSPGDVFVDMEYRR
jgi:GNAT superfamily N-acetyltransferase